MLWTLNCISRLEMFGGSGLKACWDFAVGRDSGKRGKGHTCVQGVQGEGKRVFVNCLSHFFSRGICSEVPCPHPSRVFP